MKRILSTWIAGALLLGASMVAAQETRDLRFNFGPDGLDEIEDWYQVGATEYDAARGWGWEAKPDTLRKREKAPNPVEDTAAGVSMKGAEAVFRVDLEPGLYEVVACLGDASNPANTTIYLNADVLPWVDRGVTLAGHFVRVPRTVWVRDGVLRLRIPPREKVGEPYNMVNWLRVLSVDPKTVPGLPTEIASPVQPEVAGFEPTAARKVIMPLPYPLNTIQRVSLNEGETLTFNFGPDGITVPAGVVHVGESAFRAETGWGWLTKANAMRYREMHEDILLDTMAGVNNELPVAEFAVVLEPGTYEIEVCFGDPQHRYNAELYVGEEEDLWIEQKLHPAGQPTRYERQVELKDGVLRLRIPGHSPFTMLNWAKITPLE